MQRIPPWFWLAIAATYFVCPLDFDFIFPIGYIDDVYVGWLCFNKWKAERAKLGQRTEGTLVNEQRTAA